LFWLAAWVKVSEGLRSKLMIVARMQAVFEDIDDANQGPSA
jgi:hypothetical protein